MAEIGTPENPEIIEPGQQPRAPAFSRWKLARQIFSGLVSISLPAIAIDIMAAWLIDVATSSGSLLPWIGFFLLALPAFILTFIAVLANLVLWPVLLLVVSGRLKSFSFGGQPMGRFVRFGGFGQPRP